MKVFKFLFVLMIMTIVASCSKEESIDAKMASPEQDDLTMHLLDIDKKIKVKSIDEAIYLLETEYQNVANVSSHIAYLEDFKYELAYSASLDLDNPSVERDYTNYLNKKYTSSSRAANANLYDGLTGGSFVANTAVPRNLKRSNRNIASSYVGISFGQTTLCDRTWWRGDKYFVFGIPFARVILNDFNNRTESFF